MHEDLIVESGGFELLPRVETLWYELKEHHRGIATDFPDMSTPTFELRQAGLKQRAKELLVDYVIRRSDNLGVGYCFSVIDKDHVGEIESLFVREAFRGQGFGKDLALRALAWMDQKGVTAKRVSVLSGNREAIAFYEQFGFRTRVQEMMIPKNNFQ
jgi:ribosomal protein S18 acetylase RimI-like enzyme